MHVDVNVDVDVDVIWTHVCMCARNNQPIISVSVCAQVLRLPLLIAAIVEGSGIPTSAKLMSYILDRGHVSGRDRFHESERREGERGGGKRVKRTRKREAEGEHRRYCACRLNRVVLHCEF